MAIINQELFLTKNSVELTIRSFRPGDENASKEFAEMVAKESYNTLKYEGMPDIPLERLTCLFTDYADHPVNLHFGAFDGGEVVGNLRFFQRNSNHPWIKHIGAFGMAVREIYWGQGIGSKLLQVLFNHAGSTEITRIEAEVRATNDRGVHLYEKNGFKIEGRREKAALINGKFEDEFYIAKII